MRLNYLLSSFSPPVFSQGIWVGFSLDSASFMTFYALNTLQLILSVRGSFYMFFGGLEINYACGSNKGSGSRKKYFTPSNRRGGWTNSTELCHGKKLTIPTIWSKIGMLHRTEAKLKTRWILTFAISQSNPFLSLRVMHFMFFAWKLKHLTFLAILWQSFVLKRSAWFYFGIFDCIKILSRFLWVFGEPI